MEQLSNKKKIGGRAGKIFKGEYTPRGGEQTFLSQNGHGKFVCLFPSFVVDLFGSLCEHNRFLDSLTAATR